MVVNQTIDETRLHAFLGQVVGGLAGYSGALMGYIGDRLGLYRAIAEAGSVTSAELAARTGTAVGPTPEARRGPTAIRPLQRRDATAGIP